MKGLLLTLIATIGFFNSSKADTIDFWHVYYNEIKIEEYNQYSKGEIILKIKDVKKTDSLTIQYFRDTPCFDCETQVEIENRKLRVIIKGKGRGTFNPIKISVYDLLQYQIKANEDGYQVFYHEGQITSLTQRVLIFRIKFE